MATRKSQSRTSDAARIAAREAWEREYKERLRPLTKALLAGEISADDCERQAKVLQEKYLRRPDPPKWITDAYRQHLMRGYQLGRLDIERMFALEAIRTHYEVVRERYREFVTHHLPTVDEYSDFVRRELVPAFNMAEYTERMCGCGRIFAIFDLTEYKDEKNQICDKTCRERLRASVNYRRQQARAQAERAERLVGNVSGYSGRTRRPR